LKSALYHQRFLGLFRWPHPGSFAGRRNYHKIFKEQPGNSVQFRSSRKKMPASQKDGNGVFFSKCPNRLQYASGGFCIARGKIDKPVFFIFSLCSAEGFPGCPFPIRIHLYPFNSNERFFQIWRVLA
jgi:hypothetical protein